jgi:quinol monooxygenase YgiN
MPVHVIAMYNARPGEGDELARHLQSMLEPTLEEPGCLDYRAFRSSDDPDAFAIFETYGSEDDLEAHRSSPHFAEHVRNGAWSLITTRNVVVGDEILSPDHPA